MIENEMRQPIAGWLNRNNYDDVHEALIGGYCDIVGCAWSERIGRRKPDLLEIVCVELKLRDITGVIDQARGNHYHCNLSYCAMPSGFIDRMRPQSIQQFIKNGVGLVSVLGRFVKVVVYSQYRNEIPDIVFRNRLWANKIRNRRIKGK